jgi:phosphonate transport system substrate-binding protein
MVEDLAKQFVHALEATLGRRVEVRMVAVYQDLVDALTRGTTDFAWLPPLMQLDAEKGGAALVAMPQRGGWVTFRSALLVRKGDPFTRGAQLLGTRAAWRNEQSASGYLFPRLELLTHGTPPSPPFASERFYGSVLKGAEAVVGGEADFCTTFVSEGAGKDFALAEREVAAALGPLAPRLRIVHVTELIPADGFMVAGHVAPADAQALARALHGIHTVPEGAGALKALMQAEKLVKVQPAMVTSMRTWLMMAQQRASDAASRAGKR